MFKKTILVGVFALGFCGLSLASNNSNVSNTLFSSSPLSVVAPTHSVYCCRQSGECYTVPSRKDCPTIDR